MKIFKKLVNAYNQLEEKVLVISLIFTVCLIFLQVVMRYVFNNSFSWSEELARYVFIWQCWLGTSLAFREKRHIKITIIEDALKSEKAKAWFRQIGHITMIIFCVIVVKYGWDVCSAQIQLGRVSAGTKIPMWILYLCLPFSNLVVMLRIIGESVSDLLISLGKKEPPKHDDHLAAV